MDKIAALRALRNALATLYPSIEDAQQIVAFAGLNPAAIAFSAKATNNWYNILTEAGKHNKVPRIGELAREEYPDDPALERAFQAYLAAVGPMIIPEVRTIKILFLAANPLDTEPLLLAEEVRAISQALRQAKYRDRFKLEQEHALQYADLHEALLRHEPDIVHFSGHGSDAGELLLQQPDGASHPIAGETLGELFRILKDNIRCVVLNACYSESQAQAIGEHIDAVVGMTNTIEDKAAVDFAAGFYTGIGYGRNLQTAFDLGRSRIQGVNLAEADKPRLLARHGDPGAMVFAAALGR